jgi:hypothetical protein
MEKRGQVIRATANGELVSSSSPSRIAFCSLPTAHCPLPTAYCIRVRRDGEGSWDAWQRWTRCHCRHRKK